MAAMPGERRTYRNQDESETPIPPPEPAKEGVASKAGSFFKQMAAVAVTAIVSVVAVDMYRKYKRPPESDEEFAPNPGVGMGAMPGMMAGAPQILPMPIPWPTPGGYMHPPQIQVPPPTSNPDKPTIAQELELARLRNDTAKSEAMKAQMDAFLDEE